MDGPSRHPGEALQLTPREREVVRLLVGGLSNDEIGAGLGISSKTVEFHLSRIYARCGVAGRLDLAVRTVSESWALPVVDGEATQGTP